MCILYCLVLLNSILFQPCLLRSMHQELYYCTVDYIESSDDELLSIIQGTLFILYLFYCVLNTFFINGNISIGNISMRIIRNKIPDSDWDWSQTDDTSYPGKMDLNYGGKLSGFDPITYYIPYFSQTTELYPIPVYPLWTLATKSIFKTGSRLMYLISGIYGCIQSLLDFCPVCVQCYLM